MTSILVVLVLVELNIFLKFKIAAIILGVEALNVLILLMEVTGPMPAEMIIMRNVCSTQWQQSICK